VLYDLYEFSRALLQPTAAFAKLNADLFSAPGSWLSQLPGAKPVAAAWELLYRLAKDYEKPPWDIGEVEIGRRVGGTKVPVTEEQVLEAPFCRLIHFVRHSEDVNVAARLRGDPVALLVAPYSGHHSTLLRDTVRTMLADHDVYVTDWADARMVPPTNGPFTLEDYVDYVRDFIRRIGIDRLHVIAVCQPAAPVLAATALMAAAGEGQPRSLTLMGGSVDARRSRTPVTDFASSHSLQWFETFLTDQVPITYPGHGRRVHPGFLQRAGFMALNPLRHFRSHWAFYMDLVEGDLQSADEHRRFYDEYNAVLDLPSQYYLDCIRVVFHEHLLPRGLWTVGAARVAPEALTRTGLLTIEGERDDISGKDQTRAAQDLCRGIPADRKRHFTIEATGHYGVFSGRRWRESVYPRIRDFIAEAEEISDRRVRPAPAA
jgi:poly(3-hydroxybutyrate) depolymerase